MTRPTDATPGMSDDEFAALMAAVREMAEAKYAARLAAEAAEQEAVAA